VLADEQDPIPALWLLLHMEASIAATCAQLHCCWVTIAASDAPLWVVVLQTMLLV